MKVSFIVSKLIKKIHIPAIKNSLIQKKSWVGSSTHLVDVNMGKWSYIGNQCTVINANIGKFCSIADNCIIGAPSHPIDWVSTSPVFHNGKNVMRKNFSNHKYENSQETIIGNDVWIGNNCLIKSGVTIENGSIIGMGSIVTKNIGAYEIWAGNPAKLIRKRFADDIIEKLLKSKWWENNDEVIEKNAVYFNELKKFIECVSEDINYNTRK